MTLEMQRRRKVQGPPSHIIFLVSTYGVQARNIHRYLCHISGQKSIVPVLGQEFPAESRNNATGVAPNLQLWIVEAIL